MTEREILKQRLKAIIYHGKDDYYCLPMSNYAKMLSLTKSVEYYQSSLRCLTYDLSLYDNAIFKVYCKKKNLFLEIKSDTINDTIIINFHDILKNNIHLSRDEAATLIMGEKSKEKYGSDI